jgi:prepilin peptidase CpaA
MNSTWEYLWIAIPLGLTLVAVATDLRRREVPDWVPVSIFVWAIVGRAFGACPLAWGTLFTGGLLGLVASALVYARGGFGGGDVKLIAALGAVLGPWLLVQMLFWMAMAGAVMALVAAARGERSFPYVPAIAAGLCVMTFWPDALSTLLHRQG